MYKLVLHTTSSGSSALWNNLVDIIGEIKDISDKERIITIQNLVRGYNGEIIGTYADGSIIDFLSEEFLEELTEPDTVYIEFDDEADAMRFRLRYS
jgi:hypothetical protein